jgi:hypothetical protein
MNSREDDIEAAKKFREFSEGFVDEFGGIRLYALMDMAVQATKENAMKADEDDEDDSDYRIDGDLF